MKKILTIFVLGAILSFLSIESKAQIVKGEAFMGLNLSQVDGDQAYGYRRLGFHGGLGAIVPIYKKNNSTFLDVLTGNSNIYDSLIQNENNIRVRIGDLSSLDGYNGLGAVFNGNVAIKNGPFILNSDGSGSIGTELS